MSKRFPIVFGSLTLLVWAIVLVYFVASDRIDHYLTGAFQIQALVGGIGLGILGIFNLLTSGERAADCGHDHGAEEEGCCGHEHEEDHEHHHQTCGHEHPHEQAEDAAAEGPAHAHHHHDEETPVGLVVNYSILLAPVIAAALLTPDAFSIEAMRNNAVLGESSATVREELALGNRKRQAAESGSAPTIGAIPETPPDVPDTADVPGTPPAPASATETPADPYAFTDADLENLLDKNENGDYKITVPEIFYTGGDTSLQNVLRGKPFETTGQAMKEDKNNDLGNRMRVFQLFMECCAADARPLSIPVEFASGLPDFKEMRWYRVRGTLDFETRDEVSVPVLRASTFDEIDAPAGGNFYKPPQ